MVMGTSERPISNVRKMLELFAASLTAAYAPRFLEPYWLAQDLGSKLILCFFSGVFLMLLYSVTILVIDSMEKSYMSRIQKEKS